MNSIDYSYFDVLLDGVLVLNQNQSVVYCNEPAAQWLDSSVRRLQSGKPLSHWLALSTESSTEDSTDLLNLDHLSLQEVQYQLKASGKNGKVQISIKSFVDGKGQPRKIILIRDVTLEEVLHAKHHEQLKQLENYSKNLEKMVEERTEALRQANVMLSATMNSLGQGFFVFDRQGLCSDFFTKACEDILETQPAQKYVWSVLKLNSKEKESFELWMKGLFNETLPFETMKTLGPQTYNHTQQRNVRLDYYPLRDSDSKISRIVVVATDWTNEYQAQLAFEQEKRFAKMVTKMITSKRSFSRFLRSANQAIDRIILKVEGTVQCTPEFIQELFRELHTYEGEAALYSIDQLWTAFRKPQEILEPLKEDLSCWNETFWHDFKKSLLELKNSYSHFIQSHKDLLSQTDYFKGPTLEIARDQAENLLQVLVSHGLSAEGSHAFKEKLWSRPVEEDLVVFSDIIQTMADKLGKKVNPLIIQSHGLRLMPERFESLISSFVHIFKNAIDHGIESPEDREMMGKPAVGTLRVECHEIEEADAAEVEFIFSDDGQGVSVERLKNKLSQVRPDLRLETLSDEEIIQFIFSPSLSTKDQVSEFSGRGVGLNAVQVEAEKLGGRAWVESEPGQGCRILVRVPKAGKISLSKKVA